MHCVLFPFNCVRFIFVAKQDLLGRAYVNKRPGQTALYLMNAARSVATNDLKFAIQLGHAGRKASHNVPWLGGRALSKEQDAWLTSAPSSIPFTQDSPLPKELDKDEMQQIIKNFVSATKRAVRLGFSAIEFHGAHGYLIHEFISPISNRRKDEYGGCLLYTSPSPRD